MRLFTLLCFTVVFLVAPWPASSQEQQQREKPSVMTLTPDSKYVCPGQKVGIRALRNTGPVAVNWWLPQGTVGALQHERGSSEVTYAADTARLGVAWSGDVTVWATGADTARGAPRDTASVVLHLTAKCDEPLAGELVLATVGYEQIGSSGAVSRQRYSGDFFFVRPLPFGTPQKYLGAKFKWWGRVGLASYPQQVTNGVATFASAFVDTTGKVKLNELVQTASFNTGLEIRIAGTPAVRAIGETSLERFSLNVFAGIGAVGPFPPDEDTTVFAVPAAGSPQRVAFDDAYKDVHTSNVAFVLDQPDRFLWNATAGLRLYTFFADRQGNPLSTAPAMVSVDAGFNALVDPRRRGVWHVSAVYPFPIGDRSNPSTPIVNLFGEAWMGWSKGDAAPAFRLAPAIADSKPLAITDSSVTIIPVSAKPRDTYRIGVTLDLLTVWRRLAGGGSSK